MLRAATDWSPYKNNEVGSPTMQTVSTLGGNGEGLAVAVIASVIAWEGEGVWLGDSEGMGFAVQEALRNSKIDAIKPKKTFSDIFLIQGLPDSEKLFRGPARKPPACKVFQ